MPKLELSVYACGPRSLSKSWTETLPACSDAADNQRFIACACHYAHAWVKLDCLLLQCTALAILRFEILENYTCSLLDLELATSKWQAVLIRASASPSGDSPLEQRRAA